MRALRMIPAALLLLTSAAAHAAVKLNYERKRGDETATGTMIVDAEHIRMEGMSGGRGPRGAGTVIVDAPGKRFIMIDGEKKTYRELTEADAKEMKERSEGMKAQMAER